MRAIQLNESTYDRLVGILTKKLMVFVKRSYQRYLKKFKIDEENWPDKYWPDQIDFFQYNLNNVPFKNSFIDIEFYIKRHHVENPDGIAFDGGAYIDDEIIEIIITIDPTKEPNNYKALIGHLKDTLRHEIDHLTQIGKTEKEKAIDFALKWKSEQEGNRWQYFILPEEISPMVRGLHMKAKNNKTSFDYEARKYLDNQMSYDEIEDEEKYNEILKVWKEYYNKVYNKKLQEAFIEDSDPIEDMGIGAPAIIKNWQQKIKDKDKELVQKFDIKKVEKLGLYNYMTVYSSQIKKVPPNLFQNKEWRKVSLVQDKIIRYISIDNDILAIGIFSDLLLDKNNKKIDIKHVDKILKEIGLNKFLEKINANKLDVYYKIKPEYKKYFFEYYKD